MAPITPPNVSYRLYEDDQTRYRNHHPISSTQYHHLNARLLFPCRCNRLAHERLTVVDDRCGMGCEISGIYTIRYRSAPMITGKGDAALSMRAGHGSDPSVGTGGGHVCRLFHAVGLPSFQNHRSWRRWYWHNAAPAGALIRRCSPALGYVMMGNRIVHPVGRAGGVPLHIDMRTSVP